MKGLSKSRYTAFCQCPKNLWLKVYKPEVAPVDEALQARFEQGNVVGDLAMGLFGDYKEAHAEKADGSLDLSKMVEQTRQWMDEGVENICEASFICEGGYCAVDILRKNGDGWDIYEVKSSSFPEFDGQETKLEKYAPDIAYQKWLLTQCGVEVKGTYLVCLNSNYVRQGELDLQKLFAVIDLKEMVENEYLKVPNSVKLALKVINNETEPELDLSEHCAKPYKCAFLEYCKRQHGIPEDKPTDAFTHEIIGWTLSETLQASHTLAALEQAIAQAGPDTDWKSLIHHSDRGVQYCCNDYVARLNGLGINISMTEDYCPTDNAIAERVNGIIKQEWLYRMKRPKGTREARELIRSIVDFYNNRRPHMSNCMKTPAQMRADSITAA